MGAPFLHGFLSVFVFGSSIHIGSLTTACSSGSRGADAALLGFTVSTCMFIHVHTDAHIQVTKEIGLKENVFS